MWILYLGSLWGKVLKRPVASAVLFRLQKLVDDFHLLFHRDVQPPSIIRMIFHYSNCFS